jgi:Zn-finger nucleic acid-binding protein
MKRIDDNPLVMCPVCASVWMHETDFFVLLRRYQPKVEVTELVEHNYGEERRPCPECEEMMNIVWLEHLALDRCDVHGVWLDPGELARALAWQVASDKVAIMGPPTAERRRVARWNKKIF